jgi:CheY-like chemotaxis protein
MNVPNKLILIVEDNKLNSQLISESLDRMGYSDNHIVDNYKSAIEFVDKTPPDLILMDIMLKRSKDGVTIAKKIQTNHDIPIIYISGYAQDEIIKNITVSGLEYNRGRS